MRESSASAFLVNENFGAYRFVHSDSANFSSWERGRGCADSSLGDEIQQGVSNALV